MLRSKGRRRLLPCHSAHIVKTLCVRNRTQIIFPYFDQVKRGNDVRTYVPPNLRGSGGPTLTQRFTPVFILNSEQCERGFTDACVGAFPFSRFECLVLLLL
ncbi:hypothetical protein CDAR_29321 [Caerostris darwini]|uniref:Uncharacterized protein n=1 Tax=Caerostris darwini TaxID=1538125 RepID=A0AAV4S241_9ARAC|nr:hypothetical protein CDAR_29321 [Caerostris darwini]